MHATQMGTAHRPLWGAADAEGHVPTAVRTIPVIRGLQLCPAIILEGTRRPGVFDFDVSI